MKLPIYAPKEWWLNREKAIIEDCNGCGSELDLSGKVVPDTLYGLNIRNECCCPHDYGYKFGITWLDKIFTDCIFLYNITATIINSCHNKKWYSKDCLLFVPRLLRGTKYFVAVVKAGNTSFSFEKEVSDKNEITFKGEFRYV